jgi:predicted flavoprotein YhiN
VAVVGAGAAGLTAALRAAERGARVTLLNAHPRIGLKILMSGGTRCNVTHEVVSERDFNGGSPRFVKAVLSAFTVDRTLDWMRDLGVELKLEPTGKYFPETDRAETVLDALLGAVERAGVNVESGARVVRMERGATGFRLGIQSTRTSADLGQDPSAAIGRVDWALPSIEPDRWIEAGAVILATGGLSFPRTGSDGSGYALAESLGHTLAPPVPALTPLTADDPLCGAVQGVTLDVGLTLETGPESVASRGDARTKVTGSMVFTHFGYSGPAALDLSRHWHRAAGAERRVFACFLPDQRAESLERMFVDRAAGEPRLSVRGALARELPERLAGELTREIGIEPSSMLSQLPRAQRRQLVEHVLRRPLPVTGTLGFEKAEVTAGGVSVDEVNPATMESRLVRGLYLCGEILDVEGRLGGFNFQWSWSSGTVAGRSAASR